MLCVLTIKDGGTITEKLKKYNEEVATTAENAFLKTSWGFESVLLEIILAQHTKICRLGQRSFVPFNAPAQHPKPAWLQLVVSFFFEIPHG